MKDVLITTYMDHKLLLKKKKKKTQVCYILAYILKGVNSH